MFLQFLSLVILWRDIQTVEVEKFVPSTGPDCDDKRLTRYDAHPNGYKLYEMSTASSTYTYQIFDENGEDLAASNASYGSRPIYRAYLF